MITSNRKVTPPSSFTHFLIVPLQTGRDLLRPALKRPATGLLALGGIDFGAGRVQQTATAARSTSDPVLSETRGERMRALTEEALRAGFKPLENSSTEVEEIARLYRAAHPNEPVWVWKGTGASEAQLKKLERPPRVLHLATHGFYRAPTEPSDWPMLLAGVALAGANRALRETGEDGILYAIEAQDLNLEETELVVLSACETAQGQIDYGEGVSGLVRALRTAGARYVLVTLQPVEDVSAGKFMQRFYYHWLRQPDTDPAAALRAAQLEYLESSNSEQTSPPIWAQFVLIGG